MKKITPLIYTLMAIPVSLWGQGLGLPDPDVLEQELRNDGEISNELPPYDPADYAQPDPGKLRLFESKQIEQNRVRINNILALSDENSEWLTKAQQISQKLNILKGSKLRKDFLEVAQIVHASFLEVSPLVEGEGSQESKYQSELEGLSVILHSEAFNLVKEKQANLTINQWQLISDLILLKQLWSARSWEDNSDYLGSAGGFIVDANKATTELKTKNLAEIKTFLGGDTDNSFFERYEAAGDGMDILKTKYAANKAAIQAKFAEVLAHVAQLENQQ